MQKYKITHYYEYHIDTVVKLLMDNEEPIYDLLDLPNASSITPLEERDEGNRKIIKNEWCVHGQMPKIVQKVVRPDMLTFVEDSIWDRENLTYTARIIPHHFNKQINARHKVEFYDNGDGRTKRVLLGVFEVKIPVVGSVMEPLLLKYIKQNAEEDFEMSRKALEAWIEKHGDPNAENSYKKS